MLNRIRDRFGTAGLVVSIMALVLALAGGAFAASGGLNAKQKKQVKAIAKKFAGKPGPRGPAGPAGPQGAKGDTGAAGANGKDGTNGTNGTSVTNTTELTGTGNCEGLGGTKLVGTSTTYACNGKKGTNGVNGVDGTSVENTEFSGEQGPCKEGGSEFEGTSTTYACNGSPWTLGGTLPPTKTETGVWSLYSESLVTAVESLSFPIPLANGLDEGHVEYKSAGYEGTAGANCPGSNAEPAAKAGYLCVYTGMVVNVEEVSFLNLETFEPGAGTTGTRMAFTQEGSPGIGFGTWAVTAAP